MSARPVKVLQFGQGVFLRGFVDWMLQVLNERQGLDAGVVIVRPTSRSTAPLMTAPFHVLLRGLGDDGRPVRQWQRVDCVQRELDPTTHWDALLALAAEPALRFVVSNTTEAGIAVNDTDRFDDRPPTAFPAKLCRWLHERWRRGGAGVVLLPCELVEANGPALQRAVHHFAMRWSLEAGFLAWLANECVFCSTLVDRIVSGAPGDDERAALEAELGRPDPFMVCAEPFHSWLIEGPASLADELRLDGAGLHVELVPDLRPYRQRKVGLLNGAHTLLVAPGLLMGLDSVGDAMRDDTLAGFLQAALADEIMPALPLPREQLLPFAAATLQRFRNPFVQHRLASIALNSWPKFVTRLLPQLLRYRELTGRWPPRLVLGLAALMHLYRDPALRASDSPEHLAWFAEHGAQPWPGLARGWLARRDLWGCDLTELEAPLTEALARIARDGMRQALTSAA
ncbi:tagaturonate reductase [Roseateles sp.]|uniref:tagaturonate reductase n=1 Tax=Roseateles sp. TaxID=1971397 RepID=UPI003BAB0FDD